jgi:hypothetical protein
MKRKQHIKFKLQADMIQTGFQAFKEVLPAITKYKLKTKTNEFILGKWHNAKK